jgi:hypothetical protein
MGNPVYEKVKRQIEAGIITNFEEIAKEIGKHNLCDAVGMSFETLVLRIANPGKYRIEELARLSDLLGLDHQYLLKMADIMAKTKAMQKKRGKK